MEALKSFDHYYAIIEGIQIKYQDNPAVSGILNSALKLAINISVNPKAQKNQDFISKYLKITDTIRANPEVSEDLKQATLAALLIVQAHLAAKKTN